MSNRQVLSMTCPLCGEPLIRFTIPFCSPDRGPNSRYQTYCDTDECPIGEPAATKRGADAAFEVLAVQLKANQNFFSSPPPAGVGFIAGPAPAKFPDEAA